MKKYQKLTLDDLIALKAKETKNLAQVSKGDLVEITYDNDKIIGIIIDEEESAALVLCENNSTLRWFSKYLKYRILS